MDLDGGTGATEGAYTQAYGTTLTISVPTKTGYTFAGWTLTSAGTVNGTLTDNTYTFGPAKDAADTVTALWTANKYTVVYDANGGVPTTQTKDAEYNAAYPTVADPTREGYDFAGWFTAAEGGTGITLGTTVYTLTTGTTLYAHWDIHSSTVTVDLDGGTGATSGNYTQEYGTTLTLSEPTKTGYTFAGWELSSGANGTLSGVTYTFGAAKNTTDTITAQWTINTYNVTLNTGVGYTVASTTPSTVDHGGSYSVTIALDTGYQESEAPEATVTGGASTCTVSQTGTSITYTVENITGDTVITIGDATRSNYTVSVSASGAVGIESYTPVENVSVAHGEGTEITVTLDESYSESDAPQVNLVSGAASISGGVKSTVGGKTVYTYTVTNVTADSVFHIGSASPNSYFVALNATSVGYTVNTMPAPTVLYNGSTTVVITLNEGYTDSDIPAYSVRIGDVTYSGDDNGHITAAQSGNTITYTVTGITANTQINIGSADINVYGVTLNPSNVGYTVTTNPETTVNHGGSVTFTVTLAEGYSDTSVPAISATNAASAIGYKNGYTVTYIVTGITDDTVITLGDATLNTYTVIYYPGVGVTIRDYTTHEAYAHGQRVENVPYGSVVRFTIDDTGATTPTIYANSVEIVPADGVYSVTVTSDVNITTEDLMYTAIFVNYDNQILASYVVPCGGTAVYSGATPVKPGTTYHDYVFNGWLCISPAGDWTIGQNMSNLLENRVFQAQYVTNHRNLPITCDGTKHWRYCPECGYTEGEENHIRGEVETENIVTAWCTVRGSHDEVVYCTICRRELSRTTVDDGFNYTKHTTTQTYSRVLYDATCSEPGKKEILCVNCDHHVDFEVIPVNPANHNWSAWADNGDGTHSRTCAYCGETNPTGAQTKPHSLREIYRYAATCTSKGRIVSLCPDCATVVTEILPATGKHVASDVYQKDYVAPTCVSDGSYTAVTMCTYCGEQLSSTPVTVPATGVHVYETTFDPATVACGETVTVTYQCKYCDASYTQDYTGQHNYDYTIDKMPEDGQPGQVTVTCTRCGDTHTSEIPFEPMGQRFVQFVEQSGVVYTVKNYETGAEERVSGRTAYYSNLTMKFYVSVNSTFPYSDYDVYVNGQKTAQNADGSYSIAPSDDAATVKVIGTIPAPINPGDTGTDQGSGSGSNGKISFWQRIINFFKSIGDFFRNMFNR